MRATWTGKYADNKSFKISVSNVTGFRAKVQYQSGGTNKYADVLIKDNAFRIGDTKFKLTKIGTAEIKNVITDPVERRRRCSIPPTPSNRPLKRQLAQSVHAS